MAKYSPLEDHDSSLDYSPLTSDYEVDAFHEMRSAPYIQKPFSRQYLTILTAHFLLFVSNILLCSFAFLFIKHNWLEATPRPELVYTPIKNALEYEVQQWDKIPLSFTNLSVNPNRHAKMFGPMSPETDAAWAELLQWFNIRLSEDELGEYHNNPGLVKLADGSGYAASISAYHSLHCIKRLHHLLHFDEYYPGRTETQTRELIWHGEHCLHVLMQTVKCNPDLSIFPYQWTTNERIPVALDIGHHQCYNWERIDDWMKSRSVDMFKPGLVVHPLLGVDSYDESTGNITGVAHGALLADAIRNGEIVL